MHSLFFQISERLQPTLIRLLAALPSGYQLVELKRAYGMFIVTILVKHDQIEASRAMVGASGIRSVIGR